MTSLAIGTSVLFAQDTDQKKHPCKAPLIEKVKQHGMRSMNIWEVPLFYWQRYQCRKAISNSKYLSKISDEQHEADYEASNSLQGFTSCIAYCAIASVFVFLVSSTF